MTSLKKGEFDELERERLANTRHRLYGYARSTIYHRHHFPDERGSGHRSNSFYAEDVNELGAWSCDASTEPYPLSWDCMQWRYALVRGRLTAHIVAAPWATLAMP